MGDLVSSASSFFAPLSSNLSHSVFHLSTNSTCFFFTSYHCASMKVFVSRFTAQSHFLLLRALAAASASSPVWAKLENKEFKGSIKSRDLPTANSLILFHSANFLVRTKRLDGNLPAVLLTLTSQSGKKLDVYKSFNLPIGSKQLDQLVSFILRAELNWTG